MDAQGNLALARRRALPSTAIHTISTGNIHRLWKRGDMHLHHVAGLMVVIHLLSFLAVGIVVKSGSASADKWVSRAQGAGQAYTDGVKSPKQSWATATGSADKNWAAGVQAAVGDGRFAKGVASAGDAKWQAGAINKGAARYPQGVSAAKGNYASKVQPFLDKIASLTLPPRGPKGDPGNMARSAAVASALRAMKLGK